jgi:hypothetical protein
MSGKKYLEYADECMGWAKTARSEQDRLAFIEMANTWLYAATVTERSISRPRGVNLQPAANQLLSGPT